MSWGDAHLAILNRYFDNSSIPQARVDLAEFGDDSFSPPPYDPNDSGTWEAAVWARLAVSNGFGFPFAFGSGVHERHPGVIGQQLFFPLGSGFPLQQQYAEEAQGIYGLANFSGIRCETATAQSVGKDPDLPFWQVNVTTPFERDEFTSNFGTVEDEHGMIFTQASPALNVGDAVYRSSLTTWAKAQADAEATLAEGVVVFKAGNQYKVALSGFHSWLHGFGLSQFWLSTDTPGLVTATKPDLGGTFRQQLGGTVTANLARINIGGGEAL